MSRMSSSKLVCGSHPSRSFAFVESPTSSSTSAGRRNAGSMTTCFSQSGTPASSKAISTQSRTVFILPVAMTKSSGSSRCNMRYIAST